MCVKPRRGRKLQAEEENYHKAQQTMKEEEVDVDAIQHHLGSGRFQIFAFLVLGLIYSRGAWHVFGIMFLAGDPGHKCTLPQLTVPDENTDSILSSPHLGIMKSKPRDLSSHSALGSVAVSTLPTTISMNSSVLGAYLGEDVEVMKSNWTANTCWVSYITRNGSSITLTKECPYGWSYGSTFETTVLSEWDLVCGRDFLVELSITVFMIGSMVGAMLILPLADRCGRKRVMIACLLCQACVGTATAFVNSYVLFTMLRFLIGMLNIGVGLCSYVLMTETFPTQQRTLMSIAFQAFWAGGVMTVAAFGYLVRHWRHLELLLSLPNLLALPCYWLLPESLPWLISQKRWAEALSTTKQIARINSKDVHEFNHLLPAHCDSENTSAQSLVTHSTVEGNLRTGDSAAAELDTMTNISHARSDSAETRTLMRSEKGSEGENGAEDVDCVSEGENGAEDVDCVSEGENGAEDVDCVRGMHDEGVTTGSVEEAPGACHATDEQQKVKQGRYTVIDLFRHRRMRLYSSVMFFLFFVNSVGYFGISFSVPVLHGDPFVNLCIMGAVEIPADIICMLVSQRVGRRYPSALFLLLCGISNLVAIFTPPDIVILKLIFVMLGKFAITAAYSTIYLYSAEIFPTAVRNQAMGMSSVFENIGSISAPFVVHAAKSIAELPLAVFGALSIAGACLTLLLPETHNRPLPQTVQEITAW